MKQQLLIFLLLISFPTAAQVTWPRNLETDSIEFKGLIPWQVADTSTTQRRLRVQQWFHEKLRDIRPTASTSWPSKYDNAPLTRISLAGDGYLIYHKTYNYVLIYKVMLSPTEKGMMYRLSNFTWGWKIGDSSSAWALESLPKLFKSDRLCLQNFRERVAAALAGW